MPSSSVSSPTPAAADPSSAAVVVRDEETNLAIEVMAEECYLIRDLLGFDAQTALFQYIQDRDRTPWNDLPKTMVPAPKTLLLGDNQPSLLFAAGDRSLVGNMIKSASAVLGRNAGHLGMKTSCNLLKNYASFSMAAIRYKVPDGRFPPHVDHCDNNFVFLTSLGCTAKFMVRGPETTETKNFQFRSGDVLVFNASTKAAILHGVLGIEGGACPAALGNAFPVLQDHRYGVQCRVHLERNT